MDGRKGKDGRVNGLGNHALINLPLPPNVCFLRWPISQHMFLFYPCKSSEKMNSPSLLLTLE